jgi:hypothetical protein
MGLVFGRKRCPKMKESQKKTHECDCCFLCQSRGGENHPVGGKFVKLHGKCAVEYKKWLEETNAALAMTRL